MGVNQLPTVLGAASPPSSFFFFKSNSFNMLCCLENPHPDLSLVCDVCRLTFRNLELVI
jgi:hypothetical protein